VAIVKAIEEANHDAGGGGSGMRMWRVDTTSMAKKYHSMVLGGKVRAAVGMVTNGDSGSAYCPYNLDSKSGPLSLMCFKRSILLLVSHRRRTLTTIPMPPTTLT
jgi:hypothetical protein